MPAFDRLLTLVCTPRGGAGGSRALAGCPRSPGARPTPAIAFDPVTEERRERDASAITSLGKKSGPVFTNLSAAEASALVLTDARKRLPAFVAEVRGGGRRRSAGASVVARSGGAQGNRRARPTRLAWLQSRQRVTLSGTLDIASPGRAEYVVQQVHVNDFEVPSPAIAALVRQIDRRTRQPGTSDRAIGFRVPAYVGDVRVGKGRVTLYKSSNEPPHPHRRRRAGHSRRARPAPRVRGLRGARRVANAVDGIAEYEKWRPQLVFLDVKMAGMDGLEALRRIASSTRRRSVVMISGHATIQTAVEATQLGAYDILEKPLDTDRILVHAAQRARSTSTLQEENARLRASDRVALRDRGEVVRDPRAHREDRESRRRRRRACSSPARTGRARSWSRARSTAVAARGQAVRRGELRGDPARADRERAVRPHEGLVHRRGRRTAPGSSSRPTAARSSSTRSAT